MSRKLIFGNDIQFSTSTGIATVKGIFPAEKILVISDVVTNKTLYSFSDPTTTITCTPDYSNKKTTIAILPLSSLPVGVSSNLQVFVEKEELEIKPSRTYRDPVSKFRVSEGESIIDTDFEYGLQPTKWETVKLVNNIPTYYSSTFSEEALLVDSVTPILSNDPKVYDDISVVTTSPHGLVKGSIVEISGLTDIKYEGVFVVKEVTDTFSFTYNSTVSSSGESVGDISTIYTLIYPGSFYTGSGIEILDATVDSTSSISTITVSTPNIHGLNETTNIYLKKSRGTQAFEFLSSSDVVGFGTTSQTSIINFDVASSGTGRSEYYANLPIIQDDWIGNFEINFGTSAINTTDDTITYNYKEQLGAAQNTPIATGDFLTFYTPAGNNPFTINSIDNGSSVSAPFKCFKVLDATTSTASGITTFKITSYFNGTDFQDITGTGSTTFGNHRAIKGVRVASIVYNSGTNPTTTVTFSTLHGFSANDTICFAANNPADINWEASSNNRYTNYYTKTLIAKDIVNSTTLKFGKDDLNLSYLRTTPNLNPVGVSTFIIAFKIKTTGFENSIYLPPSSGFSTESFETGQLVVLTGVNTTTNASANAAGIPFIVGTATNAEKIATLSNRLGQSSTTGIGVSYYLKQTNYPNWYNIYRVGRSTKQTINDTPLSYPYNIVLPTNNVIACFKNIYTFNSTANKKDEHTIRIAGSPFSNNKSFKYSKRAGGTVIGGLIENNSYIVKRPITNTNRYIDTDKFRVTNGITSTSYLTYFAYPTTLTATAAKMPANERYNYAILQLPNTTTASSLGITTGSYLQITDFEGGNVVQNRFINQVFRVHDSSTIPGQTAAQSVGILTNSKKYTDILLKIDSVGFNTTRDIGAIGAPSKPSVLSGFTGSKVVGIITFGSLGSGTQVASLEDAGASDGIYEIKTTENGSSEFTIESNSQIPIISKGLVIDVTTGSGADKVGTGSTPAWIYIQDHNFADGTELSYTYQGDQPLDNLNTGSYYCRVLDRNHISLYENPSDAIDRSNSSFIGIGTNGLTGITTHTFETTSVKGFIPGPGFIGITSASNIVTGLAGTTKFLSEFSNGDLLRLYQLSSTTGPGTYFETKITNVKNDVSMQIEDFIDPTDISVNQSTGVGTANYFISTRLYPMTDAKASHRSFDGGVSITSGIVPNSQIIRQTRRYFRYQSGKGIQCSMAINFNPTYDVDTIVSTATTEIQIKSKFAHNIPSTYSSVGVSGSQKIKLYSFNSSKIFQDTQEFDIKSIPDGFTLNLQTTDGSTSLDTNQSFYQYTVLNWQDSSLKAGMFDDQNGFFYKYDGSTLYAVRRDATQQISGKVTVGRNNHQVVCTSNIDNQLNVGDRVVIRGQTYKVTSINGSNQFDIQPAYRGENSNNIIISKVIDTEIPQSNWNIDRCDGTGPSGYNIDINKIQMIYMDYSWYGAGSIRFGFKNQDGEVIYVHEFVHNNDFTESYFRSGNLPARYEVETFDDPGYGPSLFHWGVSVIMDGKFDDDKAYLFTAESNTLPFTNGGVSNNGKESGTTMPNGNIDALSNQIKGITPAEASTLVPGLDLTVVTSEASPVPVANRFPPKTKITAIEIDQSSLASRRTNTYLLKVSNNSLNTSNVTGAILLCSSGTPEMLTRFIPLVSIRLAPSVDNGITGNLGFRDIINRMQLTLKSAGVLVTHDSEVRLVLNPRLSKDNYVSIGSPSLSQIYKHEVGDEFSGGIVIYSFRAQGGSVTNTTTGRRTLNVTTVELEEIALLGNSILGGDGIYPDGPDVLTVSVRPVDTSQITGSSPYIASARISWAEAQA